MTRRDDDRPYLSFPAGRVLVGALWLCFGAGLAAQPVYRVTDADGNVTFTDTPEGNGQVQVETQTVNPTNTAKAVSTAPQISEASEPDAPVHYDTRIVTPAENATIPMGPGNFTAEAALSPAMKGDERLSLLLNGEPVGAPQRMPIWQLTNVYRGEHQLQVLRLTAAGRQLDASGQHTVYVMRPAVKP